MSIGIDSLSAIEFTNAIAARFSMDLAPTVLFDHPTVESLAKFLSSELQSNEMISTTSTEDASTPQREDKSKFLFIGRSTNTAVQVLKNELHCVGCMVLGTVARLLTVQTCNPAAVQGMSSCK